MGYWYRLIIIPFFLCWLGFQYGIDVPNRAKFVGWLLTSVSTVFAMGYIQWGEEDEGSYSITRKK